MFDPNPTNWPIQGGKRWPAPQSRGGVAPSRYDVALMHYVEKQAAHRQAAARERNIWGAAAGLYALIARCGTAALRAVRPALAERPRKWAG